MQWSLRTCSTCMFIRTGALGLEDTWFDAQDSPFFILGVSLLGKGGYILLDSVSSDPDIKSEELLWVGAGSTFILHWYSF